MSNIDFNNQTVPSTPASGKTTVYVDSADKLVKSVNDAGVVTNYGAAGLAVTSLTGEVVATGPGAAAATITNSAVVNKVLTGLVASAGVLSATDTLLQAFGKLTTKQNSGFFPIGIDGDATIAADTTLIRDMYYNNLTINVGVNLFTGGFRVFAQSIANNGIIDRMGLPGIASGAGAALIAGTIGASGAGGTGGVAAGGAGVATTNSIGGAGGAAGAGSGGAGGAGGTATVPTAILGGVESFNHCDRAMIAQVLSGVVALGGAGGGGGGGDGTAGGGGGSGGGVIILVSRNISGTGTIRSSGGNGGTPLAGNRGGGGGGGGGTVILISENDVTLTSLTIAVAGGLGSSGTGTGVVGNNGSVGRIYRLRA